MLNRISSFHNYQAVQTDFRRQEGNIHHNQEQLASGKKLLSPSDNPLATHYVQNASQQSEQIRQHIENISLARGRLDSQEVILSNMEGLAAQSKTVMMRMINGAWSDSEREAYGKEIAAHKRNFVELANSKDENANYIFSGTKLDKKPFFNDSNGAIAYAGDGYSRKLKVSNFYEIPIHEPGNELFMEIKNGLGDYAPSYALQTGSELLLEKAVNIDKEDAGAYQVTFVSLGNDSLGHESFGYELMRNGKVVKTDQYDPSLDINYKGLSISFKGKISPGDTVTLEAENKLNAFEAFERVAALVKESGYDESKTAEFDRLIVDFDSIFSHIGRARTTLGVRLNTLDTQEHQHEDFIMALEKSKSNFEDLDYSEAVVEFSKNTRALQASQTAFGKTKDLSLFNYI